MSSQKDFDEKAALAAVTTGNTKQGWDYNIQEKASFIKGARYQWEKDRAEIERLNGLYEHQKTCKEWCLHQLDEKDAALESELAKSAKLREALKSMHIDDCGWDLDKLDIETARGWHKSNNEKIENALKESGDEAK